MFRIILRISSPTMNVVQLFLKVNRLFTGSRKSPKLARYRYQKLSYSASQSDLVSVIPRVNNRKDYRPVVLLSGILTWFWSKKPDGEATRLYNEALKYNELQKYEECLDVLVPALEAAQNEHNNDLILNIWVLLADMYLRLGSNYYAELALIHLLKDLFLFGFKPNSYEVIDINLKLAKLYEDTGNLRKAELGYRYCTSQVYEKLQGSVDSLEEKTLTLYVTALKLHGRFLTRCKKYKQAQKYLLEALNLSTVHNGIKHKDTVLLLGDVGTVAGLLGDVKTATSHLEEAVTIGESLQGVEYMPVLYYNLAHFYFSQKYYDKSSESCEKGFRMAISSLNRKLIGLGIPCMVNVRHVWKHGAT